MKLDDLLKSLSLFMDDPIGFLQGAVYRIGLLTLLGYLVLLLLVISIARIVKNSIGTVGKRGGGKANPREAGNAFRRGEFLRAGELYEGLGDLEMASRSYREAKAYWSLGRVTEQQRKWEDAGHYYNLAGDTEKALALYQKGGNLIKAAELCVASNQFGPAADLYEKAKEFKQASIQFERLGNLAKAASMAERAKEWLRAAEIYEKIYLQEKTPTTGEGDEATKIAQQSGTLYLKSGSPGRAVEIFNAAGLFAEAGEAHLSCGEKAKAAEAFARAKNFARAAGLFQEIGEPKRGKLLLAEYLIGEGRHQQAAEAFEEAGELLKAAELYEQSGNHEKAGDMFYATGDFLRASETYIEGNSLEKGAEALEKAGRLPQAADLYEKGGALAQAARIWESEGSYLKAGVLYRRVGKPDESIALLQKVNSASEEYLNASLELGQVLVERGMVDAAKERYRKIVSGGPVGQKTIDFYYELALLCEKTKAYDEAITLYEKVLAENIGYKDAKAKTENLKKALSTAKKAMEGTEDAKTKGEKTKVLPAKASAKPQTGGGRYRIIKKVGQGGMGVVYQAEDTVLKRIVAYKILPPSLKEHPAILSSFLQEARMAAGLNHPNIVTIYDTGKTAEDIFITLEFVDGISLKESLEKDPNQPIPELVRIMREVCKGVAYAHSKKVIHRDIKPANVMIGKDGSVKIMDFGLAKIVNQSASDKTSVKGTPLYMSPEQIVGQSVDHQSDIYSLGCSLYRMLAGRPPFIQGDVYYQHLHTPPTPPKELCPQISIELNRVILKAIEKDKKKRYKSVAELLKDLE